MSEGREGRERVEKQARGRGAQHVYKHLKREILTLEIEPGTPLDEMALSRRFAMSRSPVREALVRLSSDGLVQTLSNRSTLVAPIDLAGFPRYVEALDLLQRINTRLAARNRSDPEIETMLGEARAFDDACAKNDYLAMSGSNRDFHMAVARAGKNEYLARSYGQLLDEGRRILHMHFDYIHASEKAEMLTSDHYAMVDAIQQRDVDAADRLAHAHTRQFHDRFLSFLRATYDEGFDFGRAAAPRTR